MTKNPHPHVITGDCPVPCLTGIIRAGAVKALRYELSGEGHPYGSVSQVVKLQQENLLGGIRNIGPRAIEEIRLALKEAGLI